MLYSSWKLPCHQLFKKGLTLQLLRVMNQSSMLTQKSKFFKSMLETGKLKETEHGGWVLQKTKVNFLLCHRSLQWPHAWSIFLHHNSFLWWWQQHKPHLTMTGCNETSKQTVLRTVKSWNTKVIMTIDLSWTDFQVVFLWTSVGFFFMRFPTFFFMQR